jgi:hypothetical protein
MVHNCRFNSADLIDELDSRDIDVYNLNKTDLQSKLSEILHGIQRPAARICPKTSIPFWRANWKSTCPKFTGAFPCAFRTWYFRASSVQLTGVPLGIDFMSII